MSGILVIAVMLVLIGALYLYRHFTEKQPVNEPETDTFPEFTAYVRDQLAVGRDLRTRYRENLPSTPFGWKPNVVTVIAYTEAYGHFNYDELDDVSKNELYAIEQEILRALIVGYTENEAIAKAWKEIRGYDTIDS